MLHHALCAVLLAILPALAAAAPKDMTVYGRAPVGAFGVDTLEHVEGGAKLGMTLVYSYSPESAKKQLDVNDPMGKAVAKHKMQVLYPYHFGKLDATTRNQMRFIMTRARSLQPEVGLIGIYQAFAYDESPQWKQMPTPEQVREDMLSFYDWRADGVMAFIYHWQGKTKET
jgi:hypothetical protein